MPARRLLDPTYLHTPKSVETFGPEVADLCAKADYAPDPEQELILDATFAILPNGKSAAFEVDLIGPRQNFKTGVLKMIELGWLFVTNQRLIVHSAHELTTTEETFRETAELIEDHSFLSRYLKLTRGDRPGITAANGRWAIELKDDRRLKYKARGSTGGRGLSGDKVVLDEFFAVTPQILGSLLPVLSARPDPQYVSASSAGLLISEMLREKRDRGRKGLTPNQFYIEYSDPQGPTHDKPSTGCVDPHCTHAKIANGCALDDEERWASIMSALDTRVQRETIRSLRQAMPPAEFAREFLVWWEDPPLEIDDQIFGHHWRKQAVSDMKVPDPLALGFDVSLDRQFSGLAACGTHGEGHVVWPARKRFEGVRPGVDAAVELSLKYDIPVAVAADGPGADLIPELEEALGHRLLIAKTEDVRAMCARFFDGITETHDVWHNGDQQATEAAQCAVKSNYGDRFKWARKQSEGDITLLYAETLALWGADQDVNYDILHSLG